MSDKEKALFIIGNGFDIAHGLRTQYSNFKQFLIAKYPNIEKKSSRQFFLEDFNKLDEKEFAAEVLIDAMKNASNKDWSDFETALSR